MEKKKKRKIKIRWKFANLIEKNQVQKNPNQKKENCKFEI